MAKKKNWVKFKDIKARVSLEMVLSHYGLLGELKPAGQNLVGCCPIHQGSNPRQFSVNLERNIWHCFGNCQAGGNVLDLVARMEQVELRQAALLLQDWFPACAGREIESEPDLPAVPAQTRQAGDRVRDKKKKLVRKEKQGQPGPAAGKPAPARVGGHEGPAEPEAVNPALKFELKSLDPEHAWFQRRGIEPATVKQFGLGFCSKGLMKGRIAIPIHNAQGELVAYCGRAVSEEQIEKEGKYKLPANFVKSAVVYNLHRLEGRSASGDGGLLALVESFVSVWWLYQAGIPAVALMGSDFHELQAELLFETLGPQGRVALMFDADESGQAGTRECLEQLSGRLFVKVVDISPYGKKPHRLEPELIRELLGVAD